MSQWIVAGREVNSDASDAGPKREFVGLGNDWEHGFAGGKKLGV